LSSYPIGVTIVTWTVTDGSGNTATSTQTVTVVDAVLPTIVAPAAINVNTNSTSCTATNVPLGFPVAIDNCSVASVTNNAPVAFPLGNTTVTWTVTDGSGSTATATQVVTVRDASAPVVITQNISAFLNAAGTVTITAAQVNNGSSDNCGIASVVVTPATFNCSKLGANVVTLIVTDVNGNVASGTAIVTVVDNLAPTAVTQNITAILNPNGQVTITAAMVNNGSFDNCSVASVALSKTVFECSNLGTNTVLFTVTDGSGNTTTVPVQVTVTKRFGDVDNVCGDININVSQAITPNGDGVNDTWMISNIESYPKNNVKVFNRWGSEVFSANGYRNDWNGHYKNSDQSLPDASSYYYQIDLDGDGTIEKDGWIYISRL
jgi:gliding motility-associated-like protein